MKAVEAYIAIAKRTPGDGGPECCCRWLWDSACRYSTQLRADYMQHALNKSLTTRHNAAPAPKGKGKEKKGDERKPRSATPNRPPKGGGRGNPKGGTPRGRSTDDGGKGRDTPNKSVCYAFQKGTCTRGPPAHILTRKVSDLLPRGPEPAKGYEAVYLLPGWHLQVRREMP